MVLGIGNTEFKSTDYVLKNCFCRKGKSFMQLLVSVKGTALSHTQGGSILQGWDQHVPGTRRPGPGWTTGPFKAVP